MEARRPLRQAPQRGEPPQDVHCLPNREGNEIKNKFNVANKISSALLLLGAFQYMSQTSLPAPSESQGNPNAAMLAFGGPGHRLEWVPGQRRLWVEPRAGDRHVRCLRVTCRMTLAGTSPEATPILPLREVAKQCGPQPLQGDFKEATCRRNGTCIKGTDKGPRWG